MKNPDLPPEVLDEITRFAAVEGRKWKSVLERESWWRGLPCRDKHGAEYPLLYGLRNHPSFGPSWLASFRLPKS